MVLAPNDDMVAVVTKSNVNSIVANPTPGSTMLSLETAAVPSITVVLPYTDVI
ncbi:hypothetical protein LCGC14_2827640, partial [marine sediment metagenome]